jgi:hypothetical protein
MWKPLRQTIFGAGIIALASCSTPSLFQSSTINSRDEAAGVLVSVNMVAPWKQISDAVQPNFTLKSGDDALLQIAPATSTIQQQVLDALSGGLSAGLAQGTMLGPTATTTTGSNQSSLGANSSSQSAINTGSTSTTATTGSSGPTSSTTITAPNGSWTTNAGGTFNATNNSGTQVSSSTQTLAAALPQMPSGVPASGVLPTAPTLANAGGLDPILKYQAAYGLYQTVQLLNREVQFVASEGCFVPYLLQVKLAILPYRRHLPLDLHTRISFFLTAPIIPDATDATLKFSKALQDFRNSTSVRQQPAACQNGSSLPRVVPVLVTDDVERAVKSRTVDVARQLGLALTAMTPAVAAGGNLNSLQQSLEAVSSQDINSRLTVARQSDNTVYARIGAANEATSEYALVGQTYDVSLLLLVPISRFLADNAPHVEVSTYSEFKDSKTGNQIGERKSHRFLGQVDHAISEVLTELQQDTALDSWKSKSDQDKLNLARSLLIAIQDSDEDEFARFLEDNLGVSWYSGSERTRNFHNLWVVLSGLSSDDAVQHASIQLPVPNKIVIPDQSVLLFANPDGNDLAQIHTTSQIGENSLMANLAITIRDNNGAEKTYTLPFQSMTFDSPNRLLNIYFPSVSKWGLDNFTSARLFLKKQPCSQEMADVPTLCPREDLPLGGLYVEMVKTKSSSPDSPNFKITNTVSNITSVQGAGSVILTYKGIKDDSVTINCSGGGEFVAVTSDPAGAAALKGQTITISGKSDVSVVMKFQNLVPNTSLVIQSEGMKNGKSTGKLTNTFLIGGRV